MATHVPQDSTNPTCPAGRWGNLLLVSLLVFAVILEGYYIYLLKDKIEKRNDEMKNISIQLQLLKNEREDLKASLSSANKTKGGEGSGNTAER